MWEYYVELAFPEAEQAQAQTYSLDKLKTQGRGGTHGSKSPVWLMPRLDYLGGLGWELIEMTPQHIGRNHDVAIVAQGSGTVSWSNGYLLVFRRPNG